MNNIDLLKLVDKINRGSMSRDEIFYARDYGNESRRVDFIKQCRELQSYMNYYLDNEETILEGIKYDKYGFPICKVDSKDEVFRGIVKEYNRSVKE